MKANSKSSQRFISFLLAAVMIIGLMPMLSIPARAAADPEKTNLSTAQTAKILYNTSSGHTDGVQPLDYLSKTDGGKLSSYLWRYEANNGLEGHSAFCVEHGKSGTDVVSNFPVSPYTANYKTMGAFASGFPTKSVTIFLSSWVGSNPALAGLTEDEYAYATQVAIWATLGQIGVEGTLFSAGTEKIAVPPAGNTQATRVYTAVKTILTAANSWTSAVKTKAYVKTEIGTFNNTVSVSSTQSGVNSLEDAAQGNRNGIKKETINGIQYYTREFIVASATAASANNNNLYVKAYWTGETPDAQGSYTPAPGVIITDGSNNVLPLVNGADPKSSYYVKVETPTPKGSNSDGFVNNSEYSAKVKVCIPVNGSNSAGDAGNLSVSVWTKADQYNVYLATNPVNSRQDYIIGDPGVLNVSALGELEWSPSSIEPGKGKIILTKYDDAANTLQGAEFELTGNGIAPYPKTTDSNGRIEWLDLEFNTYIITETKAPDGYQIIAPITVTVGDGNTNVQISATDSSQHTLTIHKQDKQNNASLQGVTFRFEQINGSFVTDAVTAFDGNIVMTPKQLPYGSYKVYEIATREGYILNATPQTVDWTGEADIVMTFTNVRKAGFKLLKVDSATNRSLPGAVFDIYKNGQLITSVTTNDDGTATVSGLEAGYYEVEETSAPAGYLLDSTRHGIYIDPYNPASAPDPVLTVTNDAKPSLIILKYDEQTGKPVPKTVFEVYCDSNLIGEFTTNDSGEILLTNLDPGTYLVKEKTAAPGYVLNPTPQQVEVIANATTTVKLIFMNLVKPGIHLIKVDSVTMKPLVNAKYLISQVGGSYAHEYTTDQTGEIDLTGLEPGAYTVVETLAPAGYLIDAGIRIIQINPGEFAQFVFTDTRKPSIEIVKYDPINGIYLPGATFRVAKIEDGTHYLDRVSDTYGRIRIDDLDPGIYSVTELSAPAGYALNTTEYHVELFPGKASQLVVNNLELPKLIVRKYDMGTSLPLPGAEFSVAKMGGQIVWEGVIDSSDAAKKLERLDEGWYVITELAPPPNYVKSTESKSVYLEAGKTVEVKFDNLKKPSLTLKKYDGDTAEPLADAEFAVSEINGSIIWEGLTGADGTVTIPYLDPGDYKIREIGAPPGYLLLSLPKDVRLDAGNDTELKFDNWKKPQIVVYKYDKDTAQLLPNAEFSVAKVNGAVVYEGVTDADGKIALSGLDFGDYVITEIAPPPGYIAVTEPRNVRLEPGKVLEVKFDNRKKPDLQIIKTDAISGAPVADVTYEVRKTDTTEVKSVKTDSKGEILLTEMDPGVYEVREVGVPDNYLIAKDPVKSITLTPAMTGIVRYQNYKKPTLTINKIDSITRDPIKNVKFSVLYASNSSFTGELRDLGTYFSDAAGQIVLERQTDGWFRITEIAPSSGYTIKGSATQDVFVEAGKDKTITFENTPKSAIIIKKIDNETGLPVSGATFTVKFLGGMSGSGGTVIHEGVTSINGTIVLAGLKPGTYVIEETRAATGYELSTPAVQTAIITDDEQAVVTLTFSNAHKGNLLILKKDSVTKQPLSGATFKIVYSDGSVIGASNGEYTTDIEGVINLNENLPIGSTVVVQELKAPDGYLLDSTAQTIKIKENTTHTLTFYDAPKSGIQILKIDAVTRQPLADAHFNVAKKSGDLIGDFVTDGDGLIRLPEMDPGWIKIVETRAPAGYLLAEPQDIEIKSNQYLKVTFEDKPMSGAQIIKIDSVTKQPLKGAQFKVVKPDGAVVFEGETDGNGVLLLPLLNPGWYKAIETRSPLGYVLSDTPKDFEVTSNQFIKLTFENVPVAGLQIIKLDDDTRVPIPNTQFTISKMGGERIGDIYITDAAGVIRIPALDDGWYTVVEAKAAKGFLLDTTPHNIEVKDGKTAVLTITNQKAASILVHKVDAITGKGIYGVTFLLSDASRNPIGEYLSDQDGYVWLDGNLSDGKYFLREIKAADGYLNDDEVKTIYITGGKTTEITWKNTPSKGQIVITKLSSDYNAITNLPEGSLLAGAVFEVRNLAGNLIETITSDSRGIAATRPLVPGVYIVTEKSPPPYYTGTTVELIAQLKHDGDIVRFTVYNKSVDLGVTVDKKGNNQVQAGQTMRYDLYNVGNTSSIPLANFYLHDRLPTDATRATKLFTGTWNQRLTYSVYFKTNNKDYRVLASGLQSHINYEFSLHPNVLGLAAGEYVTDVRWEFGAVNAGFKEKENPFLFVQVLNGLTNGYQIVNRADVGGKYQTEWQTARTSWLTTLTGPVTPPRPLPKTGY